MWKAGKPTTRMLYGRSKAGELFSVLELDKGKSVVYNHETAEYVGHYDTWEKGLTVLKRLTTGRLTPRPPR